MAADVFKLRAFRGNFVYVFKLCASCIGCGLRAEIVFINTYNIVCVRVWLGGCCCVNQESRRGFCGRTTPASVRFNNKHPHASTPNAEVWFDCGTFRGTEERGGYVGWAASVYTDHSAAHAKLLKCTSLS